MIFLILEITTQTKECMDLTPQDGTSYKNDWTKVNINLGPVLYNLLQHYFCRILIS
jgi:hypothetical protein